MRTQPKEDPVRMAVRLGAAGIGIAAIVVAAAGCASGGSTPAAQTEQASFQAYLDCLSRNGVTVPQGAGRRSPGASGRPFTGASGRPSDGPSARPSGSGGPRNGDGFGGFGAFSTQAPTGVDQATWDKALQACAPVRPTAGPSADAGPDNSAQRAYRNCLSEHGVTATAGPGRLDTADPTVAAAETACEPLRPTGRPAPTPTG